MAFPVRNCYVMLPKPRSEGCANRKRHVKIWTFRNGLFLNTKADPKMKQQLSWWIATLIRPVIPCRLHVQFCHAISNVCVCAWGTYSYMRAQAQFIASLEIVVKRRSSQKVTIDEEWLSEKEMKDDYGWSTCLSQRGLLQHPTHIKSDVHSWIYWVLEYTHMTTVKCVMFTCCSKGEDQRCKGFVHEEICDPHKEISIPWMHFHAMDVASAIYNPFIYIVHIYFIMRNYILSLPLSPSNHLYPSLPLVNRLAGKTFTMA